MLSTIEEPNTSQSFLSLPHILEMNLFWVLMFIQLVYNCIFRRCSYRELNSGRRDYSGLHLQYTYQFTNSQCTIILLQRMSNLQGEATRRQGWQFLQCLAYCLAD